jgi:hypothetical protein
LVWIDNGAGNTEEWYSRLLARHPELKTSQVLGPWDLIDRCVNQGLIKGYIPYRREKSSTNSGVGASKLDCSANVATSLAGLLDAVIVDEELEDAAKALVVTWTRRNAFAGWLARCLTRMLLNSLYLCVINYLRALARSRVELGLTYRIHPFVATSFRRRT